MLEKKYKIVEGYYFARSHTDHVTDLLVCEECKCVFFGPDYRNQRFCEGIVVRESKVGFNRKTLKDICIKSTEFKNKHHHYTGGLTYIPDKCKYKYNKENKKIEKV